ncbi:MAG TPA: sigma-70 family RNA polymerase sigma factor [Gemmatimonadaceae bacterium]|jgi:RNA polymerase sigma factor (TIGR02999 family)
MTDTPGPVTQLLSRVSAGDDEAMDRIFPLVYSQLRSAAEAALRSERPGHTLQPTALVHEAFLKLVGGGPIPARDRNHFLSIAARAMRQILVDHARRRSARKRGAGETPLPLDFPIAADGRGLAFDELIALDDALEHLAENSPRLRNVVELRFFGGLNEEQVAETLGVTTRTVQRDWVRARAWLYREVYGDEGQSVASER